MKQLFCIEIIFVCGVEKKVKLDHKAYKVRNFIAVISCHEGRVFFDSGTEVN